MSIEVVCDEKFVNNKCVKNPGFTTSHTQTQYHRNQPFTCWNVGYGSLGNCNYLFGK